MNKLLWVIIAIPLLIISLYLNFEATSMIELILGTLITTGIFLGIIKTFETLKNKETKKAINYIIIIGAVLFVSFFLSEMTSGILPMVTPAHFATNTFTGECIIGGGSAYASASTLPWYYKKECALTLEQKVSIFKNTKLYNEAMTWCSDTCLEGDPIGIYCNPRKIDSIISGISCKDIMTCEKVTCK